MTIWQNMRTEANFSLPARPKGEVLWLHATTAERYLALCDAGHRLKSQRPSLTVLASWEPGMPELPEVCGCDIAAGPLPGDSQAGIRAFLDHWQPDLCIWAGGGLRLGLMRQLKERGIDALLVDIEPDELPGRKSRWLPDQRRRLFDLFTAILTPSQAVQERLRRAGVAPGKAHLSGRLHMSASPPGCDTDELLATQHTLGSRPVWLAAHARLEELPALLFAHRDALRLLHRLLLVVSLEGANGRETARAAVQSSGLRMADWDAGEEPDEYTQVLLSGGGDLGLWYRLAPVTFMAGSLEAGFGGHNPLDAVALGSAVLYGPGTGCHAGLYRRLAQAGAAAEVNGAGDLGTKVVQLSAPDTAAEMALAGWQVVTEGAGMTDLLIEKCQELLDLREARG
ncbi:3-deoxy-D-manno-octulosonic acid transferase [Roseobacteraceae bacterium NS-SX3]